MHLFPHGRAWKLTAGIAVAALLAGAVTARAQRRGFYGGVTLPTERDFEGAFNFCRVAFQQNPYGDGGGWTADYPQADINVSIRLSELTKARVAFAQADPRHFVVRLTDPALYQCPFIMMTEVGAAFLDPGEVARLREYLLKGGFLWADDFWGTRAWDAWEREIRKVLPAAEYPLIDLPKDHPLFRMQFTVATGVPQISSINHWLGTGGTSERGSDSAEPHGRAIVDRQGHMLVFITHNTDIGDSWEREAVDPQYFYNFSVHGYALGLNVLLYSMSH